MASRALICVVGALIWAIPQVVQADPILLLSGRSVSAGSRSATTSVADSDHSSDLMSVSVLLTDQGSVGSAAATMSSRLSANNREFSASGSATGVVANADSLLTSLAVAAGSLWFRVDAPYVYDFSNVVINSEIPGNPPAYTRVWATLWRDIFGVGDNALFTAWGTARQTGLLNPGRYEFVFWVEGGAVGRTPGTATGTAAFDLAFQLTPETELTATPEPASLLLIGTGMAGLWARRWLRRSQTRP